MSAPYRIEVLSPEHERAAFDCGNEPLTRYLRERASQDLRNYVAVCYVVCSPDSPSIMAYATLSAATIEVEGLPPETARRLPRYPLLPAALIGRLAVDQRVQGRGIGELLLMDMLRRCVTIRAQLGLLAVVVDAKDQRAADFYRRYGFQPLIGSQLRFFLPIKTVQTLFPNADTQP